MPTVDTLEKLARALEVPLYEIFHDGEEPLPKMKRLAVSEKLSLWGERPKEWKELVLLSRDLTRMDDRKRGLPLRMAQKLALRARKH